jgi:hypothetical protein
MFFNVPPSFLHIHTFLLPHEMLHDDVQGLGLGFFFRNRASAPLAQNARDATMNPADIFMFSWCG